jgi:hypothetical protein
LFINNEYKSASPTLYKDCFKESKFLDFKAASTSARAFKYSFLSLNEVDEKS